MRRDRRCPASFFWGRWRGAHCGEITAVPEIRAQAMKMAESILSPL